MKAIVETSNIIKEFTGDNIVKETLKNLKKAGFKRDRRYFSDQNKYRFVIHRIDKYVELTVMFVK